MFQINNDLSIYMTRGDVAEFDVCAIKDSETYIFQKNDVVRLNIYEKKNANNVLLTKNFTIEEESERVTVTLNEDETKIGGIISKPTEYWYEVVLNPTTTPQTIIGYDDDGPKVFKLFPEGDAAEELKPEDIPVIDKEFSTTSERPVANYLITARFIENEEKIYRHITSKSIKPISREEFDSMVSMGAWERDKVYAIFDNDGTRTAFYNGKYTDLTYVTNNDYYTESISGKGSITIAEEGTQTIFITITTPEGNSINGIDVTVGDKTYSTDDNGRVCAEITGETTIFTTPELTITAEYIKRIKKGFDELKAFDDDVLEKIKSQAKNLEDLNETILEQKNVYSNAVKKVKIAEAVSSITIDDISPVEHDVKIHITLPEGASYELLQAVVSYDGNEAGDWHLTDNGDITIKSKFPYIKVGLASPNYSGLANFNVEYIADINDILKKHEGEISKLPSTTYVDSKIADEISKLVSSAPDALNTLDELAKALGNDENFATNVLKEISGKADSTKVEKSLESKADGTNGIANKAIADANGNNIANTYATKTFVLKEISKIEIPEQLPVNSQLYANALKGKATGNTVTMTDVSPIEHEMSIKATSNNIPLYPYDTNTDRIAGCDYTITDDGVYKISGVCNGDGGDFLIKTLTLPAGEYTFWAEGYDDKLGVMFVLGAKPDGSNIICHFMNGNPINTGNSPFTTTLRDEVISIFFTATVTEGQSYSWSIKPYLSKGLEIAPDVSNAKLYRTGKNLLDDSILLKANGFSKTDDGYYTGKASQFHIAFSEDGTFGCLSDNFKPNTQYTFLFIGKNSSQNIRTAGFYFLYSDGDDDPENRVIVSSTTETMLKYTSKAGKTVVGLYGTYYNNDTIYLKNLCLYENSIEYTPEYTPNADGTVNGVTSLYPATTLYTDTAGINLEVEYNRDINKVYADQQKRIETLEALLLDTTTN